MGEQLLLSIVEYELLTVFLSDSFQKTKDNLNFAYRYYNTIDKNHTAIRNLYQKISKMTIEEYENVVRMIKKTL